MAPSTATATSKTTPATPALESTVDAVASYVASFEPERYSGEDAARLVTVFARLERLAGTGKTLAASRAARCHPNLSTGHRTPAEWLAATTGDSMGDALSLLKLGEALTDQPGVDGALREGKLTPNRAKLVSDAVRVNPGAEGDLVRRATTDTMPTLREECLRAKSEGRSRQDEARHHEKLRQNRRCRTYTDGDGALRLEAVLAPVTGAELVAALDTQVDRIFRAATRSGSHESPDAYRADALVALVTGRGILGPVKRNRTSSGAGSQAGDTTAGSGSASSTADAGTSATDPGTTDPMGPSDTDTDTGPSDTDTDTTSRGRQGGPGATVIVRTDLSALRRGHTRPGEVCEIEGVGPIPVDEAIEAMGRALCHLVITDGVDVTTICRLGRNIPLPLALALFERDRRCVVPGCAVTTGLEFDHWQVDYAKGGQISMDNLARLCRHHHRLKTHQGFTLIGGPGHWEFLAPDTPKQPKSKPKRTRRPTTANGTTGPPTDPGPRLFTDRE
jgi:hypothetical protein